MIQVDPRSGVGFDSGALRPRNVPHPRAEEPLQASNLSKEFIGKLVITPERVT